MDILPHISVPAWAGTRYGVLHMSMPAFPQNGANMTREEALTMIIASIAMEELALSHILNAEGEKLQYILGTLPGGNSGSCPRDVLAVNKSVTALVEAVTQNQMLLKNKLAQALEFCPLPPPPDCAPSCPPDCPPPEPGPPPCQLRPCEKSTLQLTGQREGALWNPGCRMSWKLRIRQGKDIRWDERTPARVCLNPEKSYMVRYTLNVCAALPAEGTGTVLLRQSPCGAFTDALPLYVSMADLACGPRTLQYAAVLYSCAGGGCEAELSLVWDAKKPLCVERAVLDVVEL